MAHAGATESPLQLDFLDDWLQDLPPEVFGSDDDDGEDDGGFSGKAGGGLGGMTRNAFSMNDLSALDSIVASGPPSSWYGAASVKPGLATVPENRPSTSSALPLIPTPANLSSGVNSKQSSPVAAAPTSQAAPAASAYEATSGMPRPAAAPPGGGGGGMMALPLPGAFPGHGGPMAFPPFNLPQPPHGEGMDAASAAAAAAAQYVAAAGMMGPGGLPLMGHHLPPFMHPSFMSHPHLAQAAAAAAVMGQPPPGLDIAAAPKGRSASDDALQPQHGGGGGGNAGGASTSGKLPVVGGLGLRKSASALELGSWKYIYGNAGPNLEDSISAVKEMLKAPTDSANDHKPFPGRLSPAERLAKIMRYRQKRDLRNFRRTIKYQCRKTLADSRPRIRGRFARNDEPGSVQPHETKKAQREREKQTKQQATADAKAAAAAAQQQHHNQQMQMQQMQQMQMQQMHQHMGAMMDLPGGGGGGWGGSHTAPNSGTSGHSSSVLSGDPAGRSRSSSHSHGSFAAHTHSPSSPGGVDGHLPAHMRVEVKAEDVNDVNTTSWLNSLMTEPPTQGGLL